jgi:hypothetical protein
MRLKNALAANTSQPEKHPIDKLLKELEFSEDLDVLQHALANPNIPAAGLTRALRKTYGRNAVRDDSVETWRQTHFREVTGL